MDSPMMKAGHACLDSASAKRLPAHVKPESPSVGARSDVPPTQAAETIFMSLTREFADCLQVAFSLLES